MTVPNQAMREAWDGAEGEHWANHAPFYGETGKLITPHLFQAAAINEDEHVLDIGCGFGDTTLEAGRLASGGSALGVDLSSQMLELARKKAAAERLTHVEFQQADAQVDPLGAGSFEVAISKFGIMFFEDPVAAFSNIRSALKPNGRIAILSWGELRENHWVMTIRDALAEHVDLPMPPPGPLPGPGPFSLNDADQITELFTKAGFHGIEVKAVEEPVYFGPGTDEAFEFGKGTGMVKGALMNADDATREAALATLRERLEAKAGPDGIWLDSKALLTTARV